MSNGIDGGGERWICSQSLLLQTHDKGYLMMVEEVAGSNHVFLGRLVTVRVPRVEILDIGLTHMWLCSSGIIPPKTANVGSGKIGDVGEGSSSENSDPRFCQFSSDLVAPLVAVQFIRSLNAARIDMGGPKTVPKSRIQSEETKVLKPPERYPHYAESYRDTLGSKQSPPDGTNVSDACSSYGIGITNGKGYASRILQVILAFWSSHGIGAAMYAANCKCIKASVSVEFHLYVNSGVLQAVGWVCASWRGYDGAWA
ncbi:hypothetical protein Tco_0821928 [Tanacetum coccineum]|uniref:Uncharacterized protein n=1 Tax=Tanacetum coccineum TaxID=301880 RepID=A0ABQ5AIG5_9ASTR